MSIPIEEWKWFGMAGHFICSDDCLHHLCTQIGKYIISTVGNYRPHYKWIVEKLPEMKEIGYERKFETYVFRTIKGFCSCGCGIPNIDTSEIDSLFANEIKEADEKHMILCRKYSKIED